jgi:putative salt-induced outer membrane protein
MRDLIKLVLVGCLFFSTANLFAQDADQDVEAQEETRIWEGVGEFGFVNTTGNTESTALNMKLNFTYNMKNWRHRFLATALMTSEDGEQDNERYTAEIQSDRKLNEKSWLFGVFRWDADKFGSYDPQLSLSAGYGRLLMKSEKHEMKGEVGVGYRKLEERVSGESTSEAIMRLLLEDTWQVFKTTTWNNRLLVESGSSNTFTQFDTGLAVSMTEAFAVKLGWQMRYNSKIPPEDDHNTDTVASINLVYNF